MAGIHQLVGCPNPVNTALRTTGQFTMVAVGTLSRWAYNPGVTNRIFTAVNSPSKPPKGRQYVFGCLDSCSAIQVRGWAYNRAAPLERPEIVCRVNGVEVARGEASQYRPDLKELGLGDGRYGFTLALPPRLVDGQHHMVDVRARVDGVEHSLKGGSRLHCFDPAEAMQGHAVIEYDGMVHGWALNHAAPREAVTVCISAGPEHSIRVKAEQFRPDLAELKLGTGYHGFQAILPWDWYEACAQDGKLNVDVRFEKTGTAVPGSPLSLPVAASYKARAEAEERSTEAAPACEPLISVVMPVYNPPERYLVEAIESVRGQSYTNWQLCIADDASPNPAIREILSEYAERDPRIRVVFRSKNGNISRASNSAIELVEASHFALLDHDDLFHPDALLHIARAVAANPKLGIIFSDEDKCTADGQRYGPYHKKGWDRELLLGQNCVSHLGVFRTDLVRKLGGFRAGYEGSQDYDLTLRASRELIDEEVLHIPRVLYHWRAIPGSTALANEEKSYARVAMKKALQSHLAAIGLKAAIEPVLGGVFYRVKPKLPKRLPKLSVLWIAVPGTTDEQANSLFKSLRWDGEMQIICATPKGRLLPDAVVYCNATIGNPLLYYEPEREAVPDVLERMLEYAEGELCLCVTEAVRPSREGDDWVPTMAAYALRDEIAFVCPYVQTSPPFPVEHSSSASLRGAADLPRQIGEVHPAVFMTKTKTLGDALASRHLMPRESWQRATCDYCQQRSLRNLVLPGLLFDSAGHLRKFRQVDDEPPWFSIILPTYNRRKFLSRAIESALTQKYPHFELIVVDDGSTDGTEELIHERYTTELTSGKLRYIRLHQKSGVSHARNEGLARAKYPWVAYLDSDNEMRPGFLQLFANGIQKHPEKTAFYAHFQPASGIPVVGKTFDYEALQQANYIDLGVFVHAKAALKDCEAFNTKMKRLVDWELILRLTRNNEPAHLPYAVLDYDDTHEDTARISEQESFEEALHFLNSKTMVTQ